ncbi:DJ-1/PfpI family protein [Nocardia sp. CDC159]|uniref:DJ-1/PfpI family protein n=1 Tax=Nocardia pulmonis TaxID=2951408 RepID=A0A9X2ECV1_9NOCA|nr:MULTISPECIES: DJ-1/PfpI family protein [Nocardia]MCM6778557.1 DJ-1/PfpI family protein [Nocardia pulmonis]MCM6791446.1 DJ-1/PfpI family protein [Nocardia sp. CDC159]
MTTYGLLIFDNVDEIDLAGPWEVFTVSSLLRGNADTVVLIAEHPDPVRCHKGMRIIPDHTFADHPPLDVLLIPGGTGPMEQQSNRVLTDWIAAVSARATWVTSVCSGVVLLAEAGPARGRRVCINRDMEDELEARGDVTVVRGSRYVVDGNLVTSQAACTGIDMALGLIARLHGVDHARVLCDMLQHEPAPAEFADAALDR